MTNLYYNTVKMLLERVSSVMIDHESLLLLVGYVEGAVKGTDPSIAEECGKYLSWQMINYTHKRQVESVTLTLKMLLQVLLKGWLASKRMSRERERE